MTEEDLKIYQDLYGIARRNLRRNGLVMRFGRDLVRFLVPPEDGRFDLDEMEGLSCHDVVFACYMRLLERLPEKKISNFPGNGNPVPLGCDSSYAASILPEFLNSLEFRAYHEVEDPPPPPPPPPFFVSKRLWYGLRAVLKPLFPFWLRKALNDAVRPSHA